MVSIKTIAQECGVSIATVSKALNNHNDVSEATKTIIRETAKKLGYFPNSQARALKMNKTFNIGVLFVDKAQSGFTHNYFAQVLDSLKVAAEGYGYDITFISSNIGTNKMTYLEHCRYRNIDGVVIACVDFESEEVQELIKSNIPVVTIDYVQSSKSSIICDNYEGIEQLVKHVYAKGHRKIAYIVGDESAVTSARLNSFVDNLKNLGVPAKSEYIIQGFYHDPVLTEAQTNNLLNLPDPPTCIFLPDDFSAIGAINAIKKAGLSIPEDISIVGYDGIYLSQVLNPKLTTYKQNTRKIGDEAARLLVDLIKNPDMDSQNTVMILGELLDGDSVKDIN